MEQRSKEWFLARKGKITASECYVLLNNHKEPMTVEELAEYKAANPKSRVTTKEVPFSDGTFTYLNKKIAEYYMPDDAFIEDNELKQIGNRATQHGELWEPTARTRYAELMGYEVFEMGFIPLKGYEKFAGGSPDGAIREEKGIIEIKCPWNGEVHQDYLLFTSPMDLKEYNLQYYVQMQMNMIVTETDFCDFISFDPRTSKNLQLKVLRIPRDEIMCKQLMNRIELAKQYYKERMEKLDNAQMIVKLKEW